MRVGRCDARERRQRTDVLEPAEHGDSLGAHGRHRRVERAQRRRECGRIAQFAQAAQHGDEYDRFGVFGPAAQHGAGRDVLQFGQALRGDRAHAVAGIEQRTAQCVDDIGLFPRGKHTCGFAAHVGGRIVAQCRNEGRHELGILEIGEFEQCNAAHRCIGCGDA
ncbi:hypothetical protein BamIOP4010DRAFT_6488 [Burkholderia ambifaria IOP40-10]|uniref:Uncharacterized protein n=1 Tax=Burkholderia ambifaria IOP40-10 TaxID=396596 RepID=B1FR27_9BURK|nr:hypothetical protein BamIOP4010DRAFT_6488 [Burkholderia ambifaria IOP40-10]